ncbi:MAG: dihydrofolate reductase family protein [Thermoplasmata archaeon]|nr:dihydrofolate reductase family protein [Thermoplasmata archaeon]
MPPESSPARPHVHLNCAVSLDGRLAYAGGRRALLSGPADLARVQVLRSEMDAILVGVGTIVTDDPSLHVHWELLHRPPGREPLRVILDTHGRIPPAAKVLDGSQPTLVATALACGREYPQGVARFRGGVEEVHLRGLLADLAQRGVRSILVEGGAKVLASFLRAGLADAMTVYVAPIVIGGATAPPMVTGDDSAGPEATVRLRRGAALPMDDGFLLSYSAAPP